MEYRQILEGDWLSCNALTMNKTVIEYACPDCKALLEIPADTCIDRYAFCPFCGKTRVRIKAEFCRHYHGDE